MAALDSSIEHSLDYASGMASFVTNCGAFPLQFSTPAAVCIFADFFSAGTELERLEFSGKDIPCPDSESAERLGNALRDSSGPVRSIALVAYLTMSFVKPMLIRMLFASAGPRLECLNISGLNLASEDLRKLVKVLEQCSSLLKLNIASSIIRNAGLAAGIAKVRSLESVELAWNEIVDLQGVIRSIGKLPRMRELAILSERVTCETAAELVFSGCRIQKFRLRFSNTQEVVLAAAVDQILPSALTLRDLDLDNNKAGPSAGANIVHLVAAARRLRSLNVSHNPLGMDVAVALSEAISQSCRGTLEELKISYCKLGDKGVVSVFGCLPSCPSLASLWICGNDVGDAGAKAVSERLAASPRLAELCMSGNDITSVGAKTLVPILINARELRILRFADNWNLGPEGATLILDAVALLHKENPIDEIDLSRCGIGNMGAEAMGRLVVARGCRMLRLCSNNIAVQGVASLMNSVATTATPEIDSLIISDNPVGDDETIKFLSNQIVRKNRVVAELSMNLIQISDNGGEILARALRERRFPGALRRLSVSKDRLGVEAKKVLLELQDWELATRRGTVLDIIS